MSENTITFKDIVDLSNREPDKVFKPRATLSDFERLKENRAFRDLMDEWNIWIVMIRDRLENPVSSDGNMLSHRTLDRLGGNAEAMRYIMATVENFIINLSEAQEEKSEGGRNE